MTSRTCCYGTKTQEDAPQAHFHQSDLLTLAPRPIAPRPIASPRHAHTPGRGRPDSLLSTLVPRREPPTSALRSCPLPDPLHSSLRSHPSCASIPLQPAITAFRIDAVHLVQQVHLVHKISANTSRARPSDPSDQFTNTIPRTTFQRRYARPSQFDPDSSELVHLVHKRFTYPSRREPTSKICVHLVHKVVPAASSNIGGISAPDLSDLSDRSAKTLRGAVVHYLHNRAERDRQPKAARRDGAEAPVNLRPTRATDSQPSSSAPSNSAPLSARLPASDAPSRKILHSICVHNLHNLQNRAERYRQPKVARRDRATARVNPPLRALLSWPIEDVGAPSGGVSIFWTAFLFTLRHHAERDDYFTPSETPRPALPAVWPRSRCDIFRARNRGRA
jgi:hypothetical protein